MKKRISDNYIWLILLCILFIIFFSSLIFSGEVLSGGDLINNYIPYKYFLKDSFLKHHQMPLWNPLIFSGRAFQADIQTGVFYPPNWFIFFFSPERFFSIFVMLHIIWGMLGTGKYIKVICRNCFIPYIAAVLFGFSGFNLTRLAEFSGVVIFVFTMAWTPWILFFEECFFRTRRIKHLIFLILSMAMQLFAGSPQIAFYTWIALGLIASMQIVFSLFISRSIKKCSSEKIIISGRFSRKPMGFIIGIVLAFMLTISIFGAQYFSTYEFIKGSFERGTGASFEYITSDSLTFAHCITNIVPKYFYDPNSTEISQLLKTGYHEYNYYNGMGFLFFYLIAVLLIKNLFSPPGSLYNKIQRRNIIRISLSWFILVFFGLFAAHGSSSSLFRFLYDYIPGFKSFRVPARLMMFWWLGGIILSSFVIDIYEKMYNLYFVKKDKSDENKRRIKILISLSTAVFFLIIIICAVLIYNFDIIYKKLEIFQNLGMQGVDKSDPFYQRLSITAKSSVFRSMALLTVIYIISLFFLSGKFNLKFFRVGLFIIIAIDLLLFGKSFIYSTPKNEFKERFYPETKVVKFLQENLNSGERYTWLDDVFDYRYDQNQMELFANRPMVYGISEMRGYDPNFPKTYGEFLNLICGKPFNNRQGAFLSFLYPDGSYKINYKLLSLFNLKYLLTYDKIPDENFRIAKQINFGGNILNIYENLKLTGRLYLRDDAYKNHKSDNIRITDNFFNPDKEAIPSVILESENENQDELKVESSDINIFKYNFISDSPNRQVIKVESKKSGILVFAESYDPNWQIYSNVEKQEFFPVNHALGGIYIKAGKYEIVKKYMSASLIRGKLISLTGLIILLVLALKARERKTIRKN